jgi:hypothetical protein
MTWFIGEHDTLQSVNGRNVETSGSDNRTSAAIETRESSG